MPESDTGRPPSAVDPHGTTSGESVLDAVADLIRLFVRYVRQETGDVVHDKIVQPTQKAGQMVAFAIAAALVLFMGIAFVAVGVLVLLGELLGWPVALFIVGGVLLVGAGILTAIKARRIQR